jgi:4-hydroxybenzoate polyprenyltransferase
MLRDWLELIRVPNVFTAMADVAMGFFFVVPVAAFDARAALALGMLVAASSLLYSAGMALNDVFDYEEDCRERPGRPLPSGRISRRAAARLGWGLLVAGVAVAALASLVVARAGPAIVAVFLAVWIVAYDCDLPRGPTGPIALAFCRMLNVVLGMTVAVDRLPEAGRLVVCAVGLYVLGVSILASGETGLRRRASVLLATALMMLAVGTLWWLPVLQVLIPHTTHWHLFVALMVALVAWRCSRALMDPSPVVVQSVVGQSLRSLVVLDAVIVAAVAGIVPGVAVLALLVPSAILSRWFYAT